MIGTGILATSGFLAGDLVAGAHAEQCRGNEGTRGPSRLEERHLGTDQVVRQYRADAERNLVALVERLDRLWYCAVVVWEILRSDRQPRPIPSDGAHRALERLALGPPR